MLHINIVCMYVTSLGQEESARLTDIISGVAADYNRMVGSLSRETPLTSPHTYIRPTTGRESQNRKR